MADKVIVTNLTELKQKNASFDGVADILSSIKCSRIWLARLFIARAFCRSTL